MGSAPPCARALACFVLFVTVLGPSARALAQERQGPPAEALELYRRGRAFYEAGRYREAVAELERAVMLDPSSPNLVYNVARVYELLSDLDHAILYYTRYIQLLPREDAQERERVTATLRRLQGARDAIATGAQAPPATRAPDEQLRDPTAPIVMTKRGVADPLFWVAVGTSAALLVAGGIVGVIALQRESEAEEFVLLQPEDITTRDQLAVDADNFALAADVLLIAGAASAITAALLYALRERTIVLERRNDGIALRFRGLL